MPFAQPTKVAGTLRRAVRSGAFARILGGRHMECAYYFDFCQPGASEACAVSQKCPSTISFAIDSVLSPGSWYWWILDAAIERDGRMPSPIVGLAFQ